MDALLKSRNSANEVSGTGGLLVAEIENGCQKINGCLLLFLLPYSVSPKMGLPIEDK
jgi:hypothetical protein